MTPNFASFSGVDTTVMGGFLVLPSNTEQQIQIQYTQLQGEVRVGSSDIQSGGYCSNMWSALRQVGLR